MITIRDKFYLNLTIEELAKYKEQSKGLELQIGMNPGEDIILTQKDFNDIEVMLTESGKTILNQSANLTEDEIRDLPTWILTDLKTINFNQSKLYALSETRYLDITYFQAKHILKYVKERI